MDFSIDDTQQMVVDTVRTFTMRELVPYEDEVERSGQVPPDLVEQIRNRAVDAGLYAANMPVELGGARVARGLGGIDVHHDAPLGTTSQRGDIERAAPQHARHHGSAPWARSRLGPCRGVGAEAHDGVSARGTLGRTQQSRRDEGAHGNVERCDAARDREIEPALGGERQGNDRAALGHDAGAQVEHILGDLGDGGAGRVGRRALRVGADAIGLRECRPRGGKGGEGEGGRACGGQGSDFHGFLPDFGSDWRTRRFLIAPGRLPLPGMGAFFPRSTRGQRVPRHSIPRRPSRGASSFFRLHPDFFEQWFHLAENPVAVEGFGSGVTHPVAELNSVRRKVGQRIETPCVGSPGLQ